MGDMAGSPVKGTKRQVKALLKNQQRHKTDAEIPELEGAGVVIEKLLRRVDGLEKWKAGAEKRIQDLMAWMIEERGGR